MSDLPQVEFHHYFSFFESDLVNAVDSTTLLHPATDVLFLNVHSSYNNADEATTIELECV